MEDEEVELISSTDFDRLENIKRVLEDNNIPYVYNNGFCTRHNSAFVNKKIIVKSQDYSKAKKLIEENDQFFSENAKIIDTPDELNNLDEDYFKEQEDKIKKHKKTEDLFFKILVYGILILAVIALIVNVA